MSAAVSRKAFIVLDLGFGDAGKGLLTDHLVRVSGADLVVRFNGGAQAGHNVVTPDGRHHTFSQFGSGTFAGARTLLSEHVLFHPGALLREAQALERKGVRDPLSRFRVSREATVVTPFHQAGNRLREWARGADRHGSCGVGVGEAVQDALAHPGEILRAGDLLQPAALPAKLRQLQERKRDELRELRDVIPPTAEATQEWRILDDPEVREVWLEELAVLAEQGIVASPETFVEWMQGASALVFEGAQGVLLDEDFGFHPYTTWSRCTDHNARELLRMHAPDSSVETVGVLRTHSVRHGPGPLPSETEELRGKVQEHNLTNGWQGQVRYGWFDSVLARYAAEAVGKVDVLAITHLDVLPKIPSWKVCASYLDSGPFPAEVRQLSRPAPPGLDAQRRMTSLLERVTPRYSSHPPVEAEVLTRIERLLEHQVAYFSRGPSSQDVVHRRVTP